MSCLDTKFISYALNLTKKHQGLTAPNPSVGCVIVKDNEIIASKVTAIHGRPHAEKLAIDSVTNKELLLGATIYVTLEPCCHFGKTSPCVDEIIKYKFKKVVIATKDYDSRINGKGIARLQEAGIEVICGILEERAKEIYKTFFKSRLSNLPYVTLKIATSLDGKIATKNFDSKWISNEKSRRFAHYLRSINDGILIGANTLRNDNPSLDCRIAGLEEFSPQKIIISNKLDFDYKLKIFDKPTIILTSKEPPNQIPNHSKIILCNQKDNCVDLRDAIKNLCLSGINSILVEGGKSIITQFLQEDLVDELIWIRSNKIIGNDGLAAIGDMNIYKIGDVNNKFKRKEVKEFDSDIIEILTRH